MSAQNTLSHLNKKGWVRITGGDYNKVTTKVMVSMSEIGKTGGVNLIKKEKKPKLNWDLLSDKVSTQLDESKKSKL